MSKKKKAKTKKQPRKRELPGISLEKAVARIQQMMDPNSTVNHNELIRDRRGIERQFDVVLRGTLGGYQVLGVIECKDYGRRVGLETVDEFAKKSEHVNAHIRVIVSKSGFTTSAIKAARHEGISTLSLIPSELPRNALIRLPWYAVHRTWSNHTMELRYTGSHAPNVNAPEDILCDGLPLIDYFLRELTRLKSSQPGEVRIQLTFFKPLEVVVNEARHQIAAIDFRTNRIIRKKAIKLPITGDGFFDWQTGREQVPPKGLLSVHGFTFDFSKWDDFEGDFPPTGRHQMIINFWDGIDENKIVPDLDKYGPMKLISTWEPVESQGEAK